MRRSHNATNRCGAPNWAQRMLLARRLVEAGVPFISVHQEIFGANGHSYDMHENNFGMLRDFNLPLLDRCIPALVQDLEDRGLLESTLVVWAGEFGRSPDNGIRAGGRVYGCDHNATAMTIWLAGAGVKAGHIVGATDEIGQKAVEVVHPLKDLHITILHLMGLDDARLTYFHAGRFRQLSQDGGHVIRELLA